MKKVVTLVLTLAMVLSLCATPTMAGSTEFLSLGTGGVTGTYYPLGGAFANIISNNIDGYTCTAESSGGAVENLWMLSKGEIDIGFVDASTLYQAQHREGDFTDGTASNVLGLVSIYNEVVQLVTCNPDIKTIPDLKGKKVAVGSAGSGTEVMARTLLGLYGMSYDDINEDFLGFGDASTGLKDKTLDAAIIWAGVPTSGLLELGAQNDFYILDLSDKVEELQKTQPFAVKVEVGSNVYTKGCMNSATTIAVPATLSVRADLDEQLVYDILSCFFNNLDKIAESHSQGSNMSLETALLGLENSELHPGAVRFYKEKGIL